MGGGEESLSTRDWRWGSERARRREFLEDDVDDDVEVEVEDDEEDAEVVVDDDEEEDAADEGLGA